MNKRLVDVVLMFDKDRKEVPCGDRLINEAIAKKETISSSTKGETYYSCKDKTIIPVYVIVSPILYKGEAIGTVEVFRDVSKEKEMEQSKTEFLSLASHQLRTPISIINWYLELLQNSKPEKLTHLQNKYLLEIYRASQNMGELVNALLNISRLDMGTFQIDIQVLLMQPIVESIIKEHQLVIDKKRLKVRSNVLKDLALRCDRNLFKVILQNLMSNAVKYTKDEGEIDIKVLDVGSRILITITDNGYGIPGDQKQFIFEKMFRAKNIKDKVADGTGIGLYLVKKVVNALKGEISFESKENEGSSFTVSLPKF